MRIYFGCDASNGGLTTVNLPHILAHTATHPLEVFRQKYLQSLHSSTRGAMRHPTEQKEKKPSQTLSQMKVVCMGQLSPQIRTPWDALAWPLGPDFRTLPPRPWGRVVLHFKQTTFHYSGLRVDENFPYTLVSQGRRVGGLEGWRVGGL